MWVRKKALMMNIHKSQTDLLSGIKKELKV